MKKAVLVVSFGTSYHETRKKTIEACEQKISENLKGYDFYRAFTSNMIIRKLKKRDNMLIDNPVEALQKLADAGYEEVVVQTLHIICGEEYNKLKEQVESFKPKFKKIALGRPLLTSIEDYKETVETADQAILFLPAEAIFAEINAYHQDIIDYAYKKKVWITSPTTLISTLTVIEMIIKNIERDKYTSIIHDELNKLGLEFARYKERWDKLARSIQTVNKDVESVSITADKITKKFETINKVEVNKLENSTIKELSE